MNRRHDAECYLTLAGVAHDLRSRLLRLRLHIDLRKNELGAAGADAMSSEIDEASAILFQFIEFARGEVDDSAQVCDVNSVVTEICDRYRALGHQVRAELGELGALRVNELVVRRIIANLLDNGVRYGGKEVEVTTSHTGRHLVLCVRDRGPGVRSDPKELLEPFVRERVARAKAGAGLGLSIVDRLARARGGAVSLMNRRGGGLRVVVTLAAE